jgi:Tol biopolymer transport system component
VGYVTDSSPLIGSKLGPYEILGKLGAGGMGEVFKARDTRLDRTVAVKTLPPLVAASPEFRERFEREARAISQLSHANICTLFDVGEQGGTSFLVMEHLEGETLADRIAKGPIPIAQALTWAMQIAGALNAAHRQGILHRDLKPGNIMVTSSGVKLLDFGLAKIVAGAVDGSGSLSITAPPTRTTPLTAQGTILGTFQYMAPEAVEGEEADARADIWAFGCVLYELLTGRRAFAGKSQASLFGAILKEDAPSVSAVMPLASPALDRIVRTCLAKDPNQRVQSAHDLLLNLQWVAEGGSAAGVPAPVLAGRKSRERLMWAAVAVVGAIGAAAAWIAKPAPAQTGTVTRFVHTLEPTVRFTRTGRHNVAMSPDGTFFVYVANAQLFIRRMNDVDAQPIKGSQEDPVDPVVSPDGQWVAYFVPAPGTTQTPSGTTPTPSPATLKKIPVTGGASIVLASLGFPFGVSWQDDVIVVGQGAGGVVSVPAGGGTPRQLVTLQPGEALAASPQLIDGGRSLLFSLLKSSAANWNLGDIVVQPVAGGERKVVVQGGHDGRVLPSGHLVWARDNTLFGARFDERSGLRTSDPVPLVVGVTTTAGTVTSTGAGQFSVSRDGRIAYRPGAAQVSVERRTLAWVNRQGVEQPIAAEPRGYIYPRISPDGKRIALDALDTRRDIWIWDFERDILTRLTQEANATDKRGPIWSPDGRSLFYSSTEGTRAVVLRRPADGTGASDKLAEESSTNMVPTTLTPDGQTLIYNLQIGGGANYDLKTVPLAGNRTPAALLATPRRESNAELSPDGRWLAYESDESGRLEIYVRPFPAVDAGRWQISNTGGNRPAWARNGRELFYISGDARMMAVPVSRASDNAFTYGRPAALFSTSSLYTGLIGRTYDVAADGRFLLVKQPAGAAATDNQAIVVIENWIDEVRQRLGQ